MHTNEEYERLRVAPPVPVPALLMATTIDDLQWMLQQLEGLRPGSYRASGTIADLRRLVEGR